MGIGGVEVVVVVSQGRVKKRVALCSPAKTARRVLVLANNARGRGLILMGEDPLEWGMVEWVVVVS